MPIRIGNARKGIREDPGGFMIQVQKASDPAAAAEALDRARMDIMALDGGWTSAPNLRPGITNGPKYVGEVLPAGTGPAIAVDGGYTPLKLLLTIPDLVAARLADAGVTDAVVASPDEGGTLVGGLDRLTRAVVLHLYPPPALDLHEITPVPEPLLEAADRWLRSGLVDGDHLWAAVEVLEFPLFVGAARTLLEQCNRFAPAHCWLVAGRPPTPPPAKARRFTSEEWVYVDMLNRIGGRVRAVQWSSGHLALAGGGPEVSDDGLLHIMEQLVEVARGLAPHLSYAAISIDAHFGCLAQLGSTWSADAGGLLPDVAVADAFPYQILGPGHLPRLGALPQGATALDDGRVELRIGEGAAWPPTPQQEGWDLLRPCLARRGWFEEHDERDAQALICSFPLRPHHLSEERATRQAEAAAQGTGSVPHPPLELHDPYRIDEAIALYLQAAPGLDLDPLVLAEAGGWIVAHGVEELWAVADRAPFRLEPADVLDFLSYWSAQPYDPLSPRLVAFLAGGRIRTARRALPGGVTLVGGRRAGNGSPLARDEPLALIAEFRELARRMASNVAYAFVTPGSDPRTRRWSWWSQGGEDPLYLAYACDEFCFDAYPYQVLGPGHLRRLGGLPEGARPLGSDRFELSIGTLADWLPAVQPSGRGVLAKCLLTSSEVDRLARPRQFAAGIYREGRRYPTFPQARAALDHLGGELDALEAVRQAVVLRLFLSRSAAGGHHNDVPRLWVEEAAAWICDAYDGDDELCVAVERDLQFRIAQSDAKRFLALSAMHGASSGALVAGDLMERVCGVNICCRNWPTFRWWPSLTLAIGGSARSEDDLLAAFEILRDLCRRLSDTVDYAVMSIEADWGLFWRPTEELDHPPTRSESTLDGLLGGFPYQILGPGHRARLREWPAGVVDLGNGRAELSIGDPPGWLAAVAAEQRSALNAEARARLDEMFPELDL